MIRPLHGIALFALAVALIAPRLASEESSREELAVPCVLRAEITGIVTSGTADYVADAIAEAQRCEAVLLVVDTPGGALDATRRIVQLLLGAPVPVITYVAPSGARAGSAGMFVVMAGHLAAMAPGSNIGAAHPVLGTGGDPEEAGKEMARKVENDTAALARAVAERRERNADWAEQAVRESVSATAAEAERLGVVDLVAASEQELLAALEGRSIALERGEHILALGAAEIIRHEMTWAQRARSVLGNPNIAYGLLMLGLLGLLMELYNPGGFVPGIVGLIALLLAAVGLDLLPINLGAVILIVAGVALLVGEMFVTSYGALGAAGTALIALGSVLLFDRADPEFFADPSVRVSWSAIVPLVALMAAAAILLAWRAGMIRKRGVVTGAEGLLGARAVAVTDVGPKTGRVRVGNERWIAISPRPIARGATVSVVDLEGLTLVVEPLEPQGDLPS
jgi:membrane-bound serine protease (ClpP class)